MRLMSSWQRLRGLEWVQNPDSWMPVHRRRHAWILVTPPKVLPYFAHWHNTITRQHRPVLAIFSLTPGRIRAQRGFSHFYYSVPTYQPTKLAPRINCTRGRAICLRQLRQSVNELQSQSVAQCSAIIVWRYQCCRRTDRYDVHIP